MRNLLAALSGLTVLFILLSVWMLSGDEWKTKEFQSTGVVEVPHFTVVQIQAGVYGKGVDPELELIARRLKEGCFVDLPRMEYVNSVSVPRGGEAELELRDGRTLHLRSVGNFLIKSVTGENIFPEGARKVHCKKDVLSMFKAEMVPEGEYFRCKAYPGTILWIDCPWSIFDKDAEKAPREHLSFNHPNSST